MGYNVSNIEYVKAIKVHGQYKADIQVKVKIIIKLKSQEDLQNLQVKLVSNLEDLIRSIKDELKNIPSFEIFPKT